MWFSICLAVFGFLFYFFLVRDALKDVDRDYLGVILSIALLTTILCSIDLFIKVSEHLCESKLESRMQKCELKAVPVEVVK